MKKIMGAALAAALSVSSLAAFAQQEGKVIVNGTEIQATYVKNEEGTKFIPLRGICESLGFTVNWIDEERKIEIVKLPVYITCSPDSDGYTFSRMAPQPLGEAPLLIDGTTYVPTNFVEEILGGVLTDGEEISVNYGAPTANVTVTELGENQLTAIDSERGEIVIMVDENTLVFNAEGSEIKLSELDITKKLEVTYSDAMTMSLPPITTAIKIMETTAAAEEIVEENTEGKVEELPTEEAETEDEITSEDETEDEMAPEDIDEEEELSEDIDEESEIVDEK